MKIEDDAGNSESSFKRRRKRKRHSMERLGKFEDEFVLDDDDEFESLDVRVELD